MDVKALLNAMIANFVETAPKAVGLNYLHRHYIEREARFGVILHATLIIYPDWDTNYASEWLIERIDDIEAASI